MLAAVRALLRAIPGLLLPITALRLLVVVRAGLRAEAVTTWVRGGCALLRAIAALLRAIRALRLTVAIRALLRAVAGLLLGIRGLSLSLASRGGAIYEPRQ